MKFGSVCSGIEAASVAWSPLGWQSAFFSEIEAFPSAVLSYRHPQTPNLGDMTKFKEWPDAAIDVLVGGTPCQSFSVAGLRKGLDDPRGNLMLTYLAIADRYRPRWLVWENVPGVLSSNGGRDFAAFLFGLGECGYGFAYRVLDAQYFGLAQRRKRVFVVASTRGWQSAAAVLFERASLSGNPAPRRETGKAVAPTIAGCANGGGSNGPGRDIDSVESLQVVAMAHGQGGAEIAGNRSPTLTCNHEAPIVFSPVTHNLRGEGFDASEDGTGRGTPLVPVAIRFNAQMSVPQVDLDLNQTLQAKNPAAVLAFDTTQVTSKGNVSNPKPGDPCHPLAAGAHAPAIAFTTEQTPKFNDECALTLTKQSPTGGGQPQCVAVALRGRKGGATAELGDEVGHCLRASSGGGDKPHVLASVAPTLKRDYGKGYGDGEMDPGGTVMHSMQVRRLTPRECERLQGFPDDYTAIPWRKKTADLCPDGPRYKSLGNSMAVPVMRWIGERIAMVDEIELNWRRA
jgi:DNA (cytosine-5)-methyltransferase 1